MCRGGRDGGGGGGGAGASARPCRRWVPFESQSGRLWKPLYCDGALGPCSSSSPTLKRALPTSEYRPLVADWGRLLQRVPQVTPVVGRGCARGAVPCFCRCPSQTLPLVSTGLYPGFVATQPCRRESHQNWNWGRCSFQKVRGSLSVTAGPSVRISTGKPRPPTSRAVFGLMTEDATNQAARNNNSCAVTRLWRKCTTAVRLLSPQIEKAATSSRRLSNSSRLTLAP